MYGKLTWRNSLNKNIKLLCNINQLAWEHEGSWETTICSDKFYSSCWVNTKQKAIRRKYVQMEISTSASSILKLIHTLFILVYRKRIIYLMNQPQCFEGCYPSHYLEDKLRYEVYETTFNTPLNGFKLLSVTYRSWYGKHGLLQIVMLQCKSLIL